MGTTDGITWAQIEVVKAEMFNEHYGFGANRTKICWEFRLKALDEPGTLPAKGGTGMSRNDRRSGYCWCHTT